MTGRYLKVTFHKGKPLAAYLYLPRTGRGKVKRTVDAGRGLLVDYGPKDVPMGIEITAPSVVTIADLNAVLAKLGLGRLPKAEWVPLRAA
ncbi:MAG TPA: hypothetical protein VHS09_16290 [Polyangiaceae bacterium]|jgi:hypothetical protein|nr:hypothetical protein [Polyangiaceae bacterium]